MKKPISTIVTALGISFASVSHAAQDHVLILTISDYITKPLRGVVHDAKSGQEMAQRMGFDISAARVLKDRQLNEVGLRNAIADLPKRVKSGDRVFLYYSGHGASSKLGGQCIQSLVSQDEKLVPVDFLIKNLDALKAKTSEVFVFVDACHSGGLNDIASTRSFGQDQGGSHGEKLVAKAWDVKSGEVCSTASNAAKAWIPNREASETRGMAIPTDNFTFIAAANERELALDDPDRGGLATTSVLACLRSGVKDADGSGAISAKELATCATEIVATESPKLSKKYTAHTVEAYGNVGRAIAAQAIKVSAAGNQDLAKGKAAIAAFDQFAAGANTNWNTEIYAPSRVKMSTGVPNCKRDNNDPATTSCADIAYSTSSPGYLTIFYVGSDGKEIAAITEKSMEIRVGGRQYLGSIPIVDCKGRTCPGDNTFIFIFTAERLDQSELLSKLGKDGKLDIGDAVLSGLACIAHQNSEKRQALPMQSGGSCEPLNRNALTIQGGGSGSVAGPGGYGAKVVKIVGY
jgi:Caspase domain